MPQLGSTSDDPDVCIDINLSCPKSVLRPKTFPGTHIKLVPPRSPSQFLFIPPLSREKFKTRPLNQQTSVQVDPQTTYLEPTSVQHGRSRDPTPEATVNSPGAPLQNNTKSQLLEIHYKTKPLEITQAFHGHQLCDEAQLTNLHKSTPLNAFNKEPSCEFSPNSFSI